MVYLTDSRSHLRLLIIVSFSSWVLSRFCMVFCSSSMSFSSLVMMLFWVVVFSVWLSVSRFFISSSPGLLVLTLVFSSSLLLAFSLVFSSLLFLSLEVPDLLSLLVWSRVQLIYWLLHFYGCLFFCSNCFLDYFPLGLTLPTQIQSLFWWVASLVVRWFRLLLVVGCWLLAVGCWLLAVGCWLLLLSVGGCFGASRFWVWPLRFVPLCPPSSEPALLSSESSYGALKSSGAVSSHVDVSMLVSLGSMKGSSWVMVRSNSLSVALSMESLDVSGSPCRSSTSMSLSAPCSPCSLIPGVFCSLCDISLVVWLLFVVNFGSWCWFSLLLLWAIIGCWCLVAVFRPVYPIYHVLTEPGTVWCTNSKKGFTYLWSCCVVGSFVCRYIFLTFLFPGIFVLLSCRKLLLLG